MKTSTQHLKQSPKGQSTSTKSSPQNQQQSCRSLQSVSLNNIEQLSLTSIQSSKLTISGEYQPPGSQDLFKNQYIIPLKIGIQTDLCRQSCDNLQEDVIDMFQRLLMDQKIGFKIIEKEQAYAVAVRKYNQPASEKVRWVMDYVNCLTWWNDNKDQNKSNRNITAVKINIYDHGRVSGIKLCRLKYLGRLQENFINAFTQQFMKKLQKMDIIYKQTIPIVMNVNDERIQDADTNPYHLQTCAHFLLHKIISSPQPQQRLIVQKMNKSLKQFFQSFQNIKQSSLSLPTPMINAVHLCTQLSSNIQNYINKQPIVQNYALLAPYLTISIEQYIFLKLNTLLTQIYTENCQQSTTVFRSKVRKINETLSVGDIFDEVLLDKKLRLTHNFDDHINDKQCLWKNKRDGISFVKLAYPMINVHHLHNIPSIRGKIKCCQIMYAQLKSLFFQQLNKKYEFTSMEDIIPVFIIIMLFCGQSQSDHIQQNKEKQQKQQFVNISLRAQLNMMVDYINANGEQFEAEKRLLINLSESFNYIVRDWKIE